MMHLAVSDTTSSTRINARDEISVRAVKLNDIAARHGLRVLPWHNLGSPEPMTGADDELLCASVFGWTGEEEWWHGLAQRRMCPLADLCRYHAEPFWSTAGSVVQSRYHTPHLDKIDLTWLWTKTEVRAILTVPVHMQQGQVGLVGFVSTDENIDFEDIVDELSHHSREFLISYSRVRSQEKRTSRCEALSSREIDCLNWAFYGKTDRDIAEITGRSYATVRFYMTSAANKLGTVNRAQTLAKAATLGYFAIHA